MKAFSVIPKMILFLLLIFGLQVNGQNIEQYNAPNYPFIKYSVDDGLPQSIISSLMQDSYGFIWISTNEGLAKFDGFRFKVYNEENGFPFRLITGIAEDKPGELWVATLVNGLWKLTDISAQQIPFDTTLKRFQINFLKKTYDGNILLGVEPGGLYVFKNDSIVLHISDQNGNLKGPIISADKDYRGRYWIGSFKNGVQVFEGQNKILQLTKDDGLPSNEIRSILAEPSGKIWIGTPAGIFVNGDQSFTKQWNELFPSAFISSIYSKDNRNFWINLASYPGGVVHVRDRKIVEILLGNQGFFSKSTLIGRFGTLFIGSYQGLVTIPNRNFQNYGQENGLTDEYIKAISKDSNGNLLVATKNEGLFILKNDHFQKLKKFEQEFSGNSILTVKNFNKELWIGTARGLFIIRNGNLINNQLTNFFANITVRRIKKIDEKIYIITKTNVYEIENSQLKNVTFNLSDRFFSLWGLGKDKKNRLVLATNGDGIWALKDSVWVSLATPDSIKKFFALRRDASGNLFLGTSRGLYTWDGNHFNPVLKLRETVWDVVPTKTNGIWLLTSRGLYRLYHGNIYIYNKKDGLITTEFNMGAIYRKNDNELWFGGVDGLVHFHKKIIYPNLKPELYITKIKSKDTTFVFPFKSGLFFKSNDNNLKFSFNQINFGNLPVFKFAYWLQGLNQDTILIKNGNINFVNYTNLPDGNFEFHLYLVNPLTHVIASERSVSFVILKPWWKSIWFVVLLIIAFAVFVGIIVRWREAYLKRRNLLLERQVEERTHDIKLSYKLLKQETDERKKAEISLKKEREQLAVTLKSIADGVIRTDLKGKILLMNASAEKITGVLAKEALNKNLNEIFELKNEKTNEQVLLPEFIDIQNREGKTKPFYFNVFFKHPNESKNRIVNISWTKIKDENPDKSGYVWVLRDISVERKLENEMLRTQKLESIGLLAGGIAHDFNNILSGILGNAQLAEMALDQEKDIRKFLNGIEKATQNAARLTQQLLTFAKGGEPVKEIINVQDLLRDSVEFALRGSNVSCTFMFDENLWPVEADKGQINQVINNLVINAIQAMPGGGNLKVKANNHTRIPSEKEITNLKTDHFVKISLEDTGHGIPKENLSKIFDPYFTTKQKGSGLGLATTYAIINKHGGRIAVYSELGKGTTFTIYLPAAPSEKIEQKGKGETLISWKGKRALVMDDEEYILDLMGSFLEMLGIETEFAKEGSEAIKKYQQALQDKKPFDVVIMDLTIRGGMGGKEAVKKIIKINPKAKVIVASGYSTDSVLANYKEYGFSGRLSKPFSLEELNQSLNSIFSS